MVVFRIYFFLNKKKKGYRDMADPTSRPTSRPTYPTDLPTDLANYKRARHIPKSRPILENPPPKKSIMSRKNWPCVVVVVFRIYFFLNKKKKGYRDMADPTYPTFRRRHTNTHAPPTRQHQGTRTPGGRQTTHRGGCAVETTAHTHRPTLPTRLTNQHTRRGHARLHSQQLNNARLLMRDVLAGVGLRRLAESILCCPQFGVSHVLG